MTPVLESVLGKITQEYERRLLMKENELVRARDQLTEAFRREGRFLPLPPPHGSAALL